MLLLWWNDRCEIWFASLMLWDFFGVLRIRQRSSQSNTGQNDADPFRTSGRLRRICWEGGGREAILLTSSFGVIGLTRELSRGVCHPTG
jgi:hypothetical protein